MRKTKIITVLFVAISLLFCLASAKEPEITAETAVLMEAETGQVIYQKGMHNKMYPASITKILTTILGVEKDNLDEKVIVSAEAVEAVSRNASHIALTEGEEITMREAIYAALLASANDACNVIAEEVSGSMDEFAKLMTEKAAEYGARGTNFTNSNGLKDENHYTTAYDMAMITRYGLENEQWREMFGCRRYEMPANNKQKEIRYLNNQHIMIFEREYYYEGIIGGKTGYTTEAKHTLVTAAERDGITLIAVVMKCPQNMDKYEDTKKLLDYGFENFRTINITNDDVSKKTLATQNGEVEVLLEDDISVLVPDDIRKEDIVKDIVVEDGKPFLKLSSDKTEGEELGKFPMAVASQQAVKMQEPEKEESKKAGFFTVILIVLLSVIALLAFFVLVIYIRKEIYLWMRRRARRRNRRKR